MAQIFQPQFQRIGPRKPGFGGADGGRPGGCAGSLAALAWVDAARSAPGSAGALQPQAPRAGNGPAMPVLPRHRGAVELRRNSSHQNLHELPRAALDQRATAGAGAPELGDGRSRLRGPGARPAGLCLLRPLDSCEQGDWLRELPRPGDQMPLMYAQNTLANGVVSGLPPQPGKVPAADQPDFITWPGRRRRRRGRCGARRQCEGGRADGQSVDCVAKSRVKIQSGRKARRFTGS